MRVEHEQAKGTAGCLGRQATEWDWRARAILAQDPAAAADLLADIGHQPSEAYARLRAGGEHIHHALSFYKSVEAIHYISEAQMLLAASAWSPATSGHLHVRRSAATLCRRRSASGAHE
jgi:hypothetical protein